MSETPLERGDSGLVPAGDGWFVLNVADADWKTGVFGSYTTFERKSEDGPRTFEQMGMNVSHLAPGQPLCRYHGEENQEAFLVLKGEAVLIVEEQERQLRAWDLVHTPPWADHVIVGAGRRAARCSPSALARRQMRCVTRAASLRSRTARVSSRRRPTPTSPTPMCRPTFRCSSRPAGFPGSSAARSASGRPA